MLLTPKDKRRPVLQNRTAHPEQGGASCLSFKKLTPVSWNNKQRFPDLRVLFTHGGGEPLIFCCHLSLTRPWQGDRRPPPWEARQRALCCVHKERCLDEPSASPPASAWLSPVTSDLTLGLGRGRPAGDGSLPHRQPWGLSIIQGKARQPGCSQVQIWGQRTHTQWWGLSHALTYNVLWSYLITLSRESKSMCRTTEFCRHLEI